MQNNDRLHLAWLTLKKLFGLARHETVQSAGKWRLNSVTGLKIKFKKKKKERKKTSKRVEKFGKTSGNWHVVDVWQMNEPAEEAKTDAAVPQVAAMAALNAGDDSATSGCFDRCCRSRSKKNPPPLQHQSAESHCLISAQRIDQQNQSGSIQEFWPFHS